MGWRSDRHYTECQGFAVQCRGGKHLRQLRLCIYAESGSGDRDILAEKLHISPQQMEFVTNSGPGEGLIRYDKINSAVYGSFPDRYRDVQPAYHKTVGTAAEIGMSDVRWQIYK